MTLKPCSRLFSLRPSSACGIKASIRRCSAWQIKSPRVWVRPLASVRPAASGVYPRLRAAASTRILRRGADASPHDAVENERHRTPRNAREFGNFKTRRAFSFYHSFWYRIFRRRVLGVGRRITQKAYVSEPILSVRNEMLREPSRRALLRGRQPNCESAPSLTRRSYAGRTSPRGRGAFCYLSG